MVKLLGIIMIIAGVLDIIYPFINTYYSHNPFTIIVGVVAVLFGSLLAF